MRDLSLAVARGRHHDASQDAAEELVRNEIIVLHPAVPVGKARFYPFCTQIHVSLAQQNRVIPWRIQRQRLVLL